MTSLTKAAYGAKMRRQSAPPPLPPSPPPSPHPILTYRTELKVQEIPPQLCHLTDDELAMPFPPIALGGYIRYYRAHPEHPESFNIWEQGLEKFDFQVTNSIQEVKKRRRASASTSLGSLPESSPLTKIPPTVQSIPYPLHRRHRQKVYLWVLHYFHDAPFCLLSMKIHAKLCARR